MIDNNIIGEVLLSKENRKLVCNENCNIENLCPVLVAMANADGGKVFVGIDDSKRIVGIQHGENLIKDLRVFIRDNVFPRLPYNTEIIEYEGKKLIVITVWQGSNKPYLLGNDAYVYQEDSVMKANSSQLENLFSLRGVHDRAWERKVSNFVDLQDVDSQRVKDMFLKAKTINPELNEETAYLFLEHLGLLWHGIPTNACVALFGKHPAQFIPQIRTRVSLFTNDEGNRILLQTNIYDGNLFEQIEKIEAYIKQIYTTQIVIQGLQRTEGCNLPLVAFREGLLNAMAHRDYDSVSSFLNIIIEKDKLSIVNYGGLMQGLSIQSLSTEHNSILRNPDIANVFYLSGFIEMAGSGTLRILSEVKKYRGMRVLWKEEENILTLSFEGLAHSVADTTSVTSRFFLSNPMMQENLDQIVEFIKAHPGTHIADIAAYMDKSIASIKRYLMLLRENDMLETIGDSRKGGYKIVE